MSNPNDLKYTKSDEWVKVEGTTGTIGVTDFAQSQLSDIVYLEFLIENDDEINAGSSCVTIESVKAAADVNSPITGKVTRINEALTDEFEFINSDPFGKGWMVKIEMADPSELDKLMDAAQYTKYCEEREH
jgi:glycine cleavage system H protein